MFGSSTIRRGNPACWGDKNFLLKAEDCCRRWGCFSVDMGLEDGTGLILTGPTNAIWTREKCCDRPVNRTSFHGFVNPLMYLATSHQAGTFLGDMMINDAVRFYAYELGTDVQFRMRPSSASEIPADVVREVIRCKKNKAFYEASLRERRRTFSVGTESCSHLSTGHLGGLTGEDEGFIKYVIDRLGEGKRLTSPHGRFVNIGANDGIDADPLGKTLKSRMQASALAVEMDPVNCKKHEGNLPHVHLACDMATPESIWDIILSWIPLESSVWTRDSPDVFELSVDVLKIDIDSYDCALVEEILHGSWRRREGAGGPTHVRVKPSLVVLETNDAVPPPIKMSLRYHRNLSTINLESFHCDGNLPLAGCSLSYQAAMMAKLGYGLIHYGSANAVFAQKTLLPFLSKISDGMIRGPLDEIDCYANVGISSQCGGPRQIRRWFQEGLPAWKVLEEVTNHLKAIVQDFDLPTLPLTLSL